VSQADSTVSGSYPITIVTTPTASQPAPQTISAGGSATFSMSLNANTGNPHDPVKLSCLQSTLPSGATCAFSPATITPGSSGVAFNLTVSVPSHSAALQGEHAIWTSAELSLALSPLAGLFLIAGNRNRRKYLCTAIALVMLSLLIGCGGSTKSSSTSNPATYNIQVQGTTAAQPNPVNLTVVQLTVQ